MSNQPAHVIDESFTAREGGYTLTHILKMHDVAYRASAHRNFYAFQSWAKVERFDGAKWQEVITKPGLTIHDDLQALRPGDDDQQARDVASALLSGLIEKALIIAS